MQIDVEIKSKLEKQVEDMKTDHDNEKDELNRQILEISEQLENFKNECETKSEINLRLDKRLE